ncbi:NAD/NADP octopine/nopaline dehydrogenase [Sulfitobacter noctilucicola]|uniref:Opine dehydrogenase n=1 Tax=Sulfitobacter noctilucicola TaxID=1342301 RepID=A0A7W6MBV9_9RHOB|nr:hypothetical protein [Sulfitobacter noctilucicola]KIN70231.1 NAD/NADP octopine/nopaline dehydrogenase [Sulfitobacter noctilucicola]MBB4176134.1 hypothetical protein [Sulfitobacter noctilucicola]
MPADFEDFARVASQSRSSAVATPPRFNRIAVLGGGADARLIAALSLAENCDVTLFSAYGKELEQLRASSGIALRGAGPLGSYQVDSGASSIKLTAELDAAVDGAEVIFLTGPIHKQRTYAMVLADHLADGQVLVLAPGRSLGAVEAAWMLRLGGGTADVTLVETQGLPFWFKPEGTTLALSARGPVVAATLPRGRSEAIAGLSHILPNLDEVDSVLASGFADLSAAVNIPALVMGGPGLASGGVTVPMGGVPLPENLTFASLIGSDQMRLIQAMAEERRQVARAFGVRGLPDTDEWIANHTGPQKGEGARPVPDPNAARIMLRDGVIGSLVPLSSAAELAGIDVPQTRAMIALTGAILDADIAASGRRLETMGITANSIDDARRTFDALTPGGR